MVAALLTTVELHFLVPKLNLNPVAALVLGVEMWPMEISPTMQCANKLPSDDGTWSFFTKPCGLQSAIPAVLEWGGWEVALN